MSKSRLSGFYEVFAAFVHIVIHWIQKPISKENEEHAA